MRGTCVFHPTPLVPAFPAKTMTAYRIRRELPGSPGALGEEWREGGTCSESTTCPHTPLGHKQWPGASKEPGGGRREVGGKRMPSAHFLVVVSFLALLCDKIFNYIRQLRLCIVRLPFSAHFTSPLGGGEGGGVGEVVASNCISRVCRRVVVVLGGVGGRNQKQKNLITCFPATGHARNTLDGLCGAHVRLIHIRMKGRLALLLRSKRV